MQLEVSPRSSVAGTTHLVYKARSWDGWLWGPGVLGLVWAHWWLWVCPMWLDAWSGGGGPRSGASEPVCGLAHSK